MAPVRASSPVFCAAESKTGAFIAAVSTWLPGAALDTPLPGYDVLESGSVLLDDLLVQDFVAAISRFVTVQYVEFRRSGTLHI